MAQHKRQAVVIMHGMGEQIPMQTLNGFAKAVWGEDRTLIDRDRPDSVTGGPRTDNPMWSKPDPRNNSFELRRLTTEESSSGYKTDFYEYYWAHLMHGTTLEQVQSWVMGLLFRNPFTRVPAQVMLAWVALWIVTIGIGWALIDSVMAERGPDTPLGRLVQALFALVVGWFVTNILVRRFGDVARYVTARPPNVARRQEIREKGVQLLERLIRDERAGKPTYDRIVVVAHSLGTIVAYDILTHTWARMNDELPVGRGGMAQPARAKVEHMAASALGLPLAAGADATPWDIASFQAAQADALAELRGQGHPWPISDFVTMGAPLTHAEFLMAEDMQDLRARQASRELPTCPPVMEFDRKSGLFHVGYRAGAIAKKGTGAAAEDPRIPHHAALFAYTRWSNLYSPSALILKGDIISGPVGAQFGLAQGDKIASGIHDIAVLTTGWVTHNNYWKLGAGPAPDHILKLRAALRLNGQD